jgi:orotate phosphoribosyltransferase
VPSYRQRLLDIVNRPSVLQRLPEPVRLAGGDWSDVFIDAKHGVAEPDDLELVGAAMSEAAGEAGVEFDAVGGLVLGAAPFTFAVAQAARVKWFLIRKEPKGRGTNLWIEGARIEPGLRVMLVDDIVTKGGSIQQAHKHAVEEGAEVVFATTLVDRSDVAADFFRRQGIPYTPMLTYRDLDIPRVGDDLGRAATAS